MSPSADTTCVWWRQTVLEIRVLVELTHRVAAEKRKRLRIGQLIPEHFQTDRRLLLTVLPENVHHLAVYSDGAIRSPAARPLDDFTHAVVNASASGLPSVMKIDSVSSASSNTRSSRPLQLHDVQRFGDQFFQNRRPVSRRRNDDARVARGESVTQKLGDDLSQRFVVFVEPNGVMPSSRAKGAASFI